ncbi:beta/alpha barrel domain-containing protein [Sphingobacterium corticibacterium]|uniref:Hydroxymethylglutaryl-CoA lyase n=1 Tax=Sphingobacterium corticibacterium TaxID=2484746 RepID=A0A4Q6XLG3_9SPHI|nr:hydroxymethylglutaryl-CoA lyase [Sphingobacterium corticibacterium]RZF60315.1 hydroxymethylglutaryl-CoA lyase [Sphingobacterium corticibacterium]
MSNKETIQLIECPRDAIQSIKHFIPTEKKINYINQLIDSNLFYCIDFGSFVSPKAVPQMQDTAQVLENIENKNETKLLAIIANEKGAEIAQAYDKIDFLGYPFSISETFQQRNANSTVAQSYQRVEHIKNIIASGKQELIVYISMAFGNPYSDLWNTDLVLEWIEKLSELGISRFSIADTTSEASPERVKILFTLLKHTFPELEYSIHLHSRAENAMLKIEAAHEAGCRIFEGAIMGYGGCPFAQDDLVGNIPMEMLLHRFKNPKGNKIQGLLTEFQNLIG